MSMNLAETGRDLLGDLVSLRKDHRKGEVDNRLAAVQCNIGNVTCRTMQTVINAERWNMRRALASAAAA